MSLYIRISIFILCSAAFGTSCKKDIPAPRHPDVGDWLLSKIYAVTANETFLEKEYIYGNMNRPWLDITYNRTSVPATDTAQVDTLLYNAEGRLSGVNSVFISGAGRSYRRKTVRYNAAGRLDTIRIYDPGNTTPLLFTLTFTYDQNASVVMQYRYNGNDTSPYDSTRYVYDNMRNLSELMIYPVVFYTLLTSYTYLHYDDCDNIFRHLNINVYLPNSTSSSPISLIHQPFISKNNARAINSEIYNPDDFAAPYGLFGASVATYTVDSLRLVTASVHVVPGGRETRRRYEYIPAP